MWNLPFTRRTEYGTRLWLLLAILLLSACAASPQLTRVAADTTAGDTTADIGAARNDPAAMLVSAFYGLDNGLPLPTSIRICRGAGNADGMPVIFSHEVDWATLQAGDFQVIRQSGVLGEVTCVTLAPALDSGELRTALLIGEFGSTADPPVAVRIAGNLLSLDGTLNFNGAEVAVTPLAPGPTMVLAEVVPEPEWNIGVAETAWGAGNGCPTDTLQAVRVVWAGGITRPDDTEPGDTERMLYQVRLQQPDGGETFVMPFALGDLADGDNNHLLCLDVPGTPLAVTFPAGYFTDPNGDLNPDTAVLVVP